MHRLILCGGGHVSLALARACAPLEFDIVIIDDRAEFASPARFPMASRVLAMPFADALEQLAPGGGDYVCVLTRGHAFDAACVAQVLPRGCAYVGMIGSARKCALVRAGLAEAGLPRECIATLRAPIGLAIGAESPDEIAISIAAELISVRAAAGGSARILPDGPGVEVTIVKKTGSAPRGVGANMLVRPNGEVCGTIGGGRLEFLAVQEALALLSGGGGAVTRRYDLSGAEQDPGMLCGGTVEVEFRAR